MNFSVLFANLLFSSTINTVPGSLQWRARNVLMGSVLGAAVCFPLGNSFGPPVFKIVITSLKFTNFFRFPSFYTFLVNFHTWYLALTLRYRNV